jgi:DNA-binding FadR family transcriptional regulator
MKKSPNEMTPIAGLNAADRPIKRRRLYEDLVDRIEAAILDGRYKPGDHLPSERELMETFQIGRTSVREALFALHRMGLVAITSGEKARVTLPDTNALVTDLSGAVRHLLAKSDGARHFQQARMFFEIKLAEHAAESATEQQLERLRAALEDNEKAIGNPKKFAETDVGFHFVLAKIPDNPIFVSLHFGLVAWLTEQRLTSSRALGSNQAAYRAHCRILAAIGSKDPAAAALAMRRHLEEVNDFYWAVKAREEGPR